MKLSQLSHIFLFSKPAAKHTREDRLPYTTHSRSGGRFAPVAPAGFTLVEVLVAMVILLVGIWTLAVSFPKLLGVIATEEQRTEMAQQAQRTLDQLTRHPNDLPLAIRGDSRLPAPADIDATDKPLDPSMSDFALTPANARDDMIEVIGERFTVQAPPGASAVNPVHVFRQGLATPGTVVVYKEQWLPPAFFVDANGAVTFGGALFVEINYDWVDTGGKTHHVYGEFIDSTVTTEVAAALTGTFSQVLPGYDGIRLVRLEVLLGGGPPTPIQVVEDPSGALLVFDESAVGARMRISYVLRTEPARDDRRALIMSEQHRIVSVPQDITLVGSHIDDEVPLPVGLAEDTYVLAVDTSTGDLYAEGTGLELLDAGAGEIRLGETVWRGVKGHDLRFYYVTLDQDLISTQIAPATFVDEDIANALPVPAGWELLYRTYQDLANVVDNTYTDLLFYPCNAGHTVNVKYKTTGGPNTVTADSGELYTISTEPYPDGHLYQGYHHITLNWANVEEIIAVTGKSLKAIAWWRAPNGRLERLEMNTVR